ncbi:MAG TPA: ABC transporter permease [Longimicrobiales bacterium]|nr:ABC transporter permease [Longimicrobiales bacterium]
MRNLRLAFRTLFKSPFVTTIAILSLALGIGANTAIFSLFDQILLTPLPVQAPAQLVNLSAPGPKYGSTSCNQAGDCDAVFSYTMFRDIETAETAFRGVAAHRLFSANVAYDGETVNAEGVLVSGSYFPLLGVRPAHGRLLGPQDDETIGGQPVAVLGHGFWETRLAADPGVVGRTIIVNGQPFTILGVAPPGFYGTTLGPRPVLYVPISMRGVLNPTFTGFDNRRNYWVYVFARLRPGATLEQAAASVNAVYRPIIEEVEAPLQQGMSETTMAQFRAKQVVLEDGRRGQSSTHGEARVPLLMLFATAGIVLLIACANVANLLLARGATRGMEMAVRLSLGASRRQVLGQLLTESVVLALVGGAASLLVARWTLGGMASLLPPEATDMLTFGISPSMLLFAGGLAITTGLIFGMFPALHSTRPDLVTTIRSNAGNLTVTRGAARFRSGLVGTQIALSMALLIMAGLFIRSLTNVRRVDLGLNTDNVITFSISPQLNGYEPARSAQLLERVEEELAALPGVTGVTASMVPLLAGSQWGTDVNVEGFERGPDIESNSRYNEVGPSYFATLRIPVLSGREFTHADNAAGARVAVVNEAFAEKFDLGRNAVGKFMGSDGDEVRNIEIVGLVANAKYSEVKADVPPLFFTPWRQDERVGRLSFYVRSGVDPAEIMRGIRPLMTRIDPNLPIEELKSLPQQVNDNIFLDRFISTLSAAFAFVATILAAIGLYGVLAYAVAQRTREIGVRMAIGATSGMVQRMVLKQVGVLLLLGGVVGVAAAIALGRAASSLLYGVGATDPVAIAGAVALLGLLALAAGYVPARRASRVDPLKALRYE